ncbi:hypothetical protein [Costertonia aggregata]|uniref:TolC family protein n=1 Tax=Costertonia aggregata TaxID=343403 RepID=A0A7H9AV06_9FLAO|nr:hypothetical protein [Costertonia aggregata]QLG47025.1 hypothetical protein HYG79_17245 [Costertonia aggregata]
MKALLLSFCCISLFICTTNAQSKQDSLAIRQVALDYIESQHNVKPEQLKANTRYPKEQNF